MSAVKLTAANPPGLYDPTPNGYSHSVLAEGVTRIAFIAGQGGEGPGGALAPEFAGQVKQAFANLRCALDALGASPRQVTRLGTYVVEHDQSKLDILTQQVTAMFGDWRPAQTLVPVPRLALDGMLFEVEAIAVLD